MFSFIETKLFSRLRESYLSDDEYARLQESLIGNPQQGTLVPSSGGVRKLRWSQPGRGKRGGIRLIYYSKSLEGLIYLLTIYSKSEESDIPAHILRKIREELDG